MQITRVKTRHVLFTSSPESSWDLNMHLILGEKNNYLIDTGLGSDDVAEVKNYIKHDSKPLVLINTHYHWDHVWGNAYVQAMATISHIFCRQMIEEKWDEMLAKCYMLIHGKAELKLPDLVFDRELYFPEDGIRLIYTPGHTIDSISVLDEKEGVVNMGDNIGDNMEQIVPSLYCDTSYYKDTLNSYNKFDFDTCISGHNRVLGRDVVDIIKNLI